MELVESREEAPVRGIDSHERSLPGPLSRYYLDRQARRESNARSYPRRIPLTLIEGKGVRVKDADGHVYYDCLAGAGVLALGHHHPVVLEAMKSVLDSGLPIHTLDLMTPLRDEFMQELIESLPPAFAKKTRMQFCGPTGADAVEAAIKLAKTVSGRRGFLSFHGGFHGQSHGALAVTGNLHPKGPIPGLMPEVQFLPYPYSYRCPFGIGGSQGASIGLRYIESMLSDPESGVVGPAGLILEIIQGEGGVIPAPDCWVRELRRITRGHNIPMIVDEIQTGWGRTGKLYAFQHSDITPDILVLSKAIGGGLPLSVLLYDEALDSWAPAAHTGTFRGNQLAMAAGLATLRFIRSQSLAEHAEAMGNRLMRHLKQLQGIQLCVGDVRGRGLMLGVEIVHPDPGTQRNPPPAHGALAKEIQAQCLRLGLILEVGGRFGSVVRFLPPLIITEQEVDEVAEIFASAVGRAEKALRT